LILKRRLKLSLTRIKIARILLKMKEKPIKMNKFTSMPITNPMMISIVKTMDGEEEEDKQH
jgi:hypothetical protein